MGYPWLPRRRVCRLINWFWLCCLRPNNVGLVVVCDTLQGTQRGNTDQAQAPKKNHILVVAGAATGCGISVGGSGDLFCWCGIASTDQAVAHNKGRCKR